MPFTFNVKTKKELEEKRARLRALAGGNSRLLQRTGSNIMVPANGKAQSRAIDLAGRQTPSPPLPRGVPAHVSGMVAAAAPLRSPTLAARRLSQATASDEDDFSSGHTFLEAKAVGDRTSRQYHYYLRLFIAWVLANQLLQPSSLAVSQVVDRLKDLEVAKLDNMMVDYLDSLYFDGGSVGEAEKSKAALCFAIPSISALSMVRTTRAIAGFRRLAPGGIRSPLPYELLCAIVGVIASAGKLEFCLALLIAFTCYLRPNELFMRVRDLVLPRSSTDLIKAAINLGARDSGKPTKTGVFDDAVILDSTGHQFLLRLMTEQANHRLKSTTESNPPMWSFTLPDLKEVFNQAACTLGLTDLCLYQLRHGGATWDAVNAQREWMEIKARGRWMSDTSIRRYAKPGVLQRYRKQIDEKVLMYGDEISKNMEAVLGGKTTPVPFSHSRLQGKPRRGNQHTVKNPKIVKTKPIDALVMKPKRAAPRAPPMKSTSTAMKSRKVFMKVKKG